MGLGDSCPALSQDRPEDYGVLTYVDEDGEEKIVKDHETIALMEMLEAGIQPLK
ncbi:hypothetical protein GIY09_01025 [Aerococcaceae bacterium WS4759]|uniref:Uncharacterized protein n=1 Tax=Fundicoccus ignavus TaxID=2664442 RepID=A0A6I2GF46_9LACT|nr:hypothetical protein [Fundicoccus ignavus]MRI84482.1 hypothetical protein [Fundicoccus ignavus]